MEGCTVVANVRSFNTVKSKEMGGLWWSTLLRYRADYYTRQVNVRHPSWIGILIHATVCKRVQITK